MILYHTAQSSWIIHEYTHRRCTDTHVIKGRGRYEEVGVASHTWISHLVISISIGSGLLKICDITAAINEYHMIKKFIQSWHNEPPHQTFPQRQKSNFLTFHESSILFSQLLFSKSASHSVTPRNTGSTTMQGESKHYLSGNDRGMHTHTHNNNAIHCLSSTRYMFDITNL